MHRRRAVGILGVVVLAVIAILTSQYVLGPGDHDRGGWQVGYQPDWDEVLQRFKQRGPNLDEYMEILKSSHADVFGDGCAPA
jgi:hypothetical protein